MIFYYIATTSPSIKMRRTVQAATLLCCVLLPAARARAETLASVKATVIGREGNKLTVLIRGSLIGRDNPKLGFATFDEVGYLATISIAAGADKPDCKLFGPYTEQLDAKAGTRSPNQPGSGHPMEALAQLPLLYDSREGKLIRWTLTSPTLQPNEIYGPSDDKYSLSYFDDGNAAWSPPKTVEIHRRMASNVYWRCKRYKAHEERVKGSTKRFYLYDTFADRECDDPWINDLMAELRKNETCSRAECTCDENLKWLVVEPRNPIRDDLDDERSGRSRETEPGIFGELKFDRQTSFLVFVRGTAKPYLVNRPAGQSVFQMRPFSDRKGDLFFLYWMSPPKSLVRWKDGRTFIPKDPSWITDAAAAEIGPEDSSLIGSTSIGKQIPVEHDGQSFGCDLRLTTWRYLENKRDVETIPLGDFFEVNGKRIVLKGKQATPIAEP